MNQQLISTILLAACFLLLFTIAEVLYHKLKWKAEVTRKIVHVCTGLLSLLFPLYLSNQIYVLVLCASFLLILIGSLKWNLLKSINAVSRKTVGSLLYPFTVYICFLVSAYFDDLNFYYLPILCLAFCDPIAAFIGKKFPYKPYKIFGHTKTLSGSLAFFFSAFLLCVFLFLGFADLDLSSILWQSLCIGIISTSIEAISHKGLDNISIPMSALGLLILFQQ